MSHRLDEVFEIADQVTVLRGGRVVETRPVPGLNVQALAELMVGADVDAGYRAGLPVADGREVVLRARNVRSRFLRGVDVELREGEVLGVAGLPGSGRDELPYALAGALAGATGQVEVCGQGWLPLRKSASFDIPIVPADRGREAVISEFCVGENLTISVLDRFRKFGWLRRRPERELVGDWMSAIEVKATGSGALITTLSGGNQQKVMMARCLARDPRVLVLCEPTAGVDVGTRQAIYEFIADAGQGRPVAACLLLRHRRPAGHLHPGARHVQRPRGPRTDRRGDHRADAPAGNGRDGADMTTSFRPTAGGRSACWPRQGQASTSPRASTGGPA